MGKLSPNSKFSLTLKELIAAAFGLGSLLVVFFTLKSEIALAKELPRPEVTQIELSYKDELIQKGFEKVQADMNTIKEEIKNINLHLQTMDERLYEISKNNK